MIEIFILLVLFVELYLSITDTIIRFPYICDLLSLETRHWTRFPWVAHGSNILNM